MRKCPICKNEGKEIFKGRIMKKYEVQYYQCERCALVYTETPYWLDEAYAGDDAIADIDTGIMQRNISNCILVNWLIKLFFDYGKIFVDVGGGYGIFARMMRDLGYNWLWSDKYADNLVARGFEYNKLQYCKVDLVTAFELFEHFSDPLLETQKILCISKNVIFSTEIYDNNFLYKPFEDWWYYASDTGQHISFYSKKTLEYIASINGVHYYEVNKGIHIFTEHKISTRKLKWLVNNYLYIIQCYYFHKRRRKGLAFSDMQSLRLK